MRAMGCNSTMSITALEPRMTMPDDSDRLTRDLARRAERLTTAMREFETLSLAVSHDFRMPLRAIETTVRAIASGRRDLDAETRRGMQVIGGAVAHLEALIDNLAGLCRAASRPMDLQHVDMEDLAREAWTATPRAQGIALSLGRLPAARGDREMLKLAWMNLFINAVARCADSPHPLIEVTGGGSADFSVYSVRDNGAELALHFTGKLFYAFEQIQQQSRHPGTGVALAIVQRIVTRHRGNVWVDTAPDKGTIFQFSIGEIHPEAPPLAG
jgi:signal transduction histidine kinase